MCVSMCRNSVNISSLLTTQRREGGARHLALSNRYTRDKCVSVCLCFKFYFYFRLNDGYQACVVCGVWRYGDWGRVELDSQGFSGGSIFNLPVFCVATIVDLWFTNDDGFMTTCLCTNCTNCTNMSFVELGTNKCLLVLKHLPKTQLRICVIIFIQETNRWIFQNSKTSNELQIESNWTPSMVDGCMMFIKYLHNVWILYSTAMSFWIVGRPNECGMMENSSDFSKPIHPITISGIGQQPIHFHCILESARRTTSNAIMVSQ